MNRKLSHLAVALLAAGSLLQISCTNDPTGQGALAGAALGGIVGGIAGDGAGEAAAGAAIGAVAGALTGQVVKNKRERDAAAYGYGPGSRENADVQRVPSPSSPDYSQAPRQSQPQYQQPRQQQPDYPVARRSNQSGHVISPYAPYNIIDARDFKSGDLALDPTTDKIFRVP